MTPTRLLPLLLLIALLVGSVSGGLVVNPGAGYFVIHKAQHQERYEPSGYTAPKAVSDNIVMFVLVCLVFGPISLMGMIFSGGNTIICAIILIFMLAVLIGYIFPTFTLMTNAMAKEQCVPNTAFNTSCGDKQ